MDYVTLDADNPDDYKRMRDLIAPSLARYEQSGPPSVRLEVGPRGDVQSNVPSIVLPSKYGDQSTWTQAEKEYNENMRKLLSDAELRPFASAAQRTAAMLDVMLCHPAVFSSDHRAVCPLTEDTNMADSPRYVSQA